MNVINGWCHVVVAYNQKIAQLSSEEIDLITQYNIIASSRSAPEELRASYLYYKSRVRCVDVGRQL